MSQVQAKKSLGQHFLKDQNIARKIVESLRLEQCTNVLEVGPGMGMLTRFLLDKPGITLRIIEIDRESVAYLHDHFPQLGSGIIAGDYLKIPADAFFPAPYAVIGNFPYNISSQIFFKILENRNQVPEVVGMVQKEVAERISSGPGNKTYGILSVLLQAFYHIDYLFTVGEQVFSPPPRVKSAVIRLTRNEKAGLDCDELLFFRVVKTAFNQRRKMLGNALKSLQVTIPGEFATLRAEQLTVAMFEKLTRHIECQKNPE